MMNPLLVPYLLIALTVMTSIIGFRNQFFWLRYRFEVGAVLRDRQYRRIIGHAFLHADWLHLLFNMLTLYFFSRPVVFLFGWPVFLLVYFGAVAAGAGVSLLLYRHRPSYAAIGASGGVAGVMFAAIAVMPKIGLYLFFIPIPIEGWLFGLLFFAYSAYRMVNPKHGDNLAHAAHLGGAAAGMLAALLFAYPYAVKNLPYMGMMILPWFYLIHAVWLRGKRL